ncbi:hypothetical protein F4819DRAFT_305431 [Hypoxylon fuscum]|nr:hypothetical protein F4819DRAFT_305431 [Hypoxylon fuscum]
MAAFPPEIFNCVFSLAAHQTLLNCRLLNKQLSSLATSHAFRHIYLEAAGDVSHFVKISQTPHLRSQVREVSIDTLVESFQYHRNETPKFPLGFFLALSDLRLFSELKKLNLIFNEYCGNEEEHYTLYSIEENYDFRYWVLWTAFSCLTGEWTAQSSSDLYEELDITFYENEESIGQEVFLGRLNSGDTNDLSGRASVIALETLTIRNLAGYDDTRLTSSDLFKKVLSTVTDLKLYIVFETYDSSPENEMYFPEPYGFMESLDKTWLAPEIARNLRVLSLFCDNYWGWIPKMDFRDVNPSTGPESGFPKLEVLALGNYVFSHEWQIGWFASLGHHNRYGGLRELYLDDCPILYFARIYGELDQTPGSVGYPLKESILAQQWENEVNQNYHMRWHHVLPRWRENMTALKVFRMGHGNWRSHQTQLIQEAYNELGIEWKNVYWQRFDRMNFETFDCHPGVENRSDVEDYAPWFEGVGIGEDRDVTLQYIHFNHEIGPSQWVVDEEAENADFEKPRALDEQSLEGLRATIRDRN